MGLLWLYCRYSVERLFALTNTVSATGRWCCSACANVIVGGCGARYDVVLHICVVFSRIKTWMLWTTFLNESKTRVYFYGLKYKTSIIIKS